MSAEHTDKFLFAEGEPLSGSVNVIEFETGAMMVAPDAM